jgi:hypothetical protein
MGELVFSILLFVAVVAVAMICFFGWILMKVISLGGWVMRQLRGPRPAAMIKCRHLDCLAPNPDTARFCRRCGRPLHTHMQVFRAA